MQHVSYEYVVFVGDDLSAAASATTCIYCCHKTAQLANGSSNKDEENRKKQQLLKKKKQERQLLRHMELTLSRNGSAKFSSATAITATSRVSECVGVQGVVEEEHITCRLPAHMPQRIWSST